jgi:GTPase SAR1 family protein
MILFVDGIDGSGKTTLISHLLDHLAAQGKPAVVAPALWSFLDPISEPGAFAHWVTHTPGVDVGHQLLLAMQRRLDKLRIDLDHRIMSREATVLVDRGPRTVASSARAHARTGRPSVSVGPRPDHAFRDHEDALAAKVASLADVLPVAAVELCVDDATVDVALSRLAPHEELTDAYVTYIRAFSAEVATASPRLEVPTLRIDAAASTATNVERVIAWMERIPTATP